MKRDLFNHELMNFKNIFFLLVCVLLYNPKVSSQEYPFELPNTITSTINIETTKTQVFNNKLLGYNIEGFNSSLEKSFIKLVDPVTIRFPHGLWANFYEWETDGYQQDEWDHGSHQAALDVYDAKVKGHIGSIATLNNEKKAIANGKGYDMMWTYSVNFDDGPSSVARAKKDIGLGLEVKAIELGNEHFWKTQRSQRTATAADYLREASAISAALKSEFPNIKLSIPLGWRRNQGGYNATIIGNGNYFDAITVHKYLGADPDIPGESDKAYSSLLTAKLELAEDVNWVRNNYAPDKPVWLTEWGVSAGTSVHGGACLGMADAYLYMSENQQIFERANWFSFNRVLNAMVVVGANRQPVYPLKQRGYLSTYNILKDVFRDAIMLKTTVTSSTQLTTARGSVNAVNARATVKDGKTTVVAINLTNKPVEFELKLDNITYTGNFKHDALIFNDLGVVEPIDFYADALTPVKEGSGTIMLPPLSISKITNIVNDISVHIIEGTLEAEDFNESKEGVTISSNADRTYANDINTGDWLTFDVNVTETGMYDFEFEYAAAISSGLVRVELDNVLLFDNFSLPQTSSAIDFKTAIYNKVDLMQGLHSLKITIQSGSISLDKINVNFIHPLEKPTFVSLKDGDTVIAGSNIEVEASSSVEIDKIVSMELFIDDVSVRIISEAPFKWGYDGQNDVLLENKNEGQYVLKLVLTDNENRTAESSVTIYVGAQEADLTKDVFRLRNVATGEFLADEGGWANPLSMKGSGEDTNTHWTFVTTIIEGVEYYNIDSETNGIIRATNNTFSNPYSVVSTGKASPAGDADKRWLVHYYEADATYRFESNNNSLFLYHDQDGGVYNKNVPESDDRSKWKAISTSEILSATDKEILQSSVIVYPNPAKDKFTIAFKNLNEVRVEVYNVLGEVMYRATTNKNSIEIVPENNFKSGIYIVKVLADNQKIYVSKLFIK